MIPIALQLYSVREECAKDLAGVLAAVAKMGYQGVEFAGTHGHSAEELRDLLAANRLQCCGAHVGIEHLVGSAIEKTIEFHKTVGNISLIVPGLPHERTATRAAWLETARFINEVAVRLKPAGMRTGYHNHHTEFKPLEGELPWDMFFGNTSPDVVMQFDTGNALVAGAHAAEFIKRYPGRAKTVHLKEHSASKPNALIGEGDVDWPVIFELCETVGATEWYIVEQESFTGSPMDGVEQCLKNLRAMGK